MPTNRKRKLRKPKSHIPADISREYFEALECRDFLADCTDDIYCEALNDNEAALLREYLDCDRDFEKWKNQKVRNADK